MSNRKILARILAFVLAFSFVVSGIPFGNFGSVIEVYADREGGGSGGSGGGGTPGTGGDHPIYSGSGWRISLFDADIYTDEYKRSQIQDALEENKSYSILVANRGGIKIPLTNIDTGEVEVASSVIAPSIEAIFPGAPSGYNPSPLGSNLSSGYDFSDAYWEAFGEYVRTVEDKGVLIDGVWSYLKANGYPYLEDPRTAIVSEKGIAISVEPVEFWETCGFVWELSYQDCLGGDSGKTRPYFERLMNTGSANGLTHNFPMPASTWINYKANHPHPSDSTTKISYMGKFNADVKNLDTGETVYNALDWRPDGLDGGVAYFFIGDEFSNPSSKAETNIAVAYNGTPGSSDGSLVVNRSHNFVTEENATKIKAHTTISEIETVDEENYKLKLSSYGTTFMNPFGDSDSGNLETLVDRLSDCSSNFFDSYVVTYGGSYTVKTAVADRASVTSNLLSPLDTYIDGLEKESVSWGSTLVEGGNFNIGSKKVLTLGAEGKKPNTLAKEIDDLAPFRAETSKAVSEMQIYSDTIPSANPEPIVANLALSALGGSRFGEFDTSTYSTTEDNSYGISIEFLTKKVPVTSYIAYATVNKQTRNVTLGKTDSVTYDSVGSGQFTIECDESAIFVAIPNTGGYSLATDGDGSSVFNNAVEVSNVDDLKNVISSQGGDVGEFVGDTVSTDQLIKVGTNGSGTGYSIFVISFADFAAADSGLKLNDYELNYIYPSMVLEGQFAALNELESYKDDGGYTAS